MAGKREIGEILVDTTMTLRGRVGTDLQTSRTKTGTLCVRFRLAVAQWRRTDSGDYEEIGVRWYSIRAWGRLADYVLPSIRKGDPVIVIGRPSANAWADHEGEIRADLVFTAVAVGHDLNYGMTRFNKHGGTMPVVGEAPQGTASSEPSMTNKTKVSVSTEATPADSEFRVEPVGEEERRQAPPYEEGGIFNDAYSGTPPLSEDSVSNAA